MKNINDVINKNNNLKERVLQFGEGNFLRAFADWYIDCANNQGFYDGSVVIVQPRAGGHIERLSNQNSLYNVVLRGRDKGEIIDSNQVITSISRCINPFTNYDALLDFAVSDDLQIVISNTTEAGIEYINGEKFDDAPNVSYPAKLTALLFERYKAEKGGLLILPVELIEDNGKVLKEYVLRYASDWSLGDGFVSYIENECAFCSTLVDRIVTGYPKNDSDMICNKLGYKDNCLVVAEPFNCWIIQGDKKYKNIFPIDKINDNVIWTDDLSPYRKRKVRILNGAHTMSVLAAYMSGIDIVRDMMNDCDFNSLIQKAFDEEIIPTITDLPRDELVTFANSVTERFNNPFIDHKLLDISLNSVSKFKARCIPTIIDYIDMFGTAPKVLSFGMASLICFYQGEFADNAFVGRRENNNYIINDGYDVCKTFDDAYKSKDVVKTILENNSLWGAQLIKLSGFYDAVKMYYDSINDIGIKRTIEKII